MLVPRFAGVAHHGVATPNAALVGDDLPDLQVLPYHPEAPRSRQRRVQPPSRGPQLLPHDHLPIAALEGDLLLLPRKTTIHPVFHTGRHT